MMCVGHRLYKRMADGQLLQAYSSGRMSPDPFTFGSTLLG